MPTQKFPRRQFLQQAALAAPILAATRAFAFIPPPPPPTGKMSRLSISVRTLGALGDGTTKDTVAIQQTIDRVAVLGGGDVLFPPGDYLSGALVLRSNVTLLLQQGATLHGSPSMADYPLTQVRWEGRWITGYSSFISAMDAQNIAILGPGSILGSSAIVGRVERTTQRRLPALFEFNNCNQLNVADLSVKNFGMWAIHPVYCSNVSFRNVTINSGADGIDVDSCKRVVIENCNFTTADDCISLKSGRGLEANTLMRTTEDVRISGCTFNDSNFACIGIGSETSGGIRNVHITHCKFTGAKSFAIYIKSRPGRGAFIRDIFCDDLDVANMQQGFLRFNILNSGKQDEFPVPGLTGIPSTSNFRFTNIRVTGVPILVDGGAVHPQKPLDGLTLANITGTCARGIVLANVRHADLRGLHVTGFTGPLLSTHNVTGTGLAAAVPFDPLTVKAYAVPDPIPQPATPYQLH